MILGLGIDLVQVQRLEAALERTGPRLLERLFTGDERTSCEALGGGAQRWAARFAAKEAVLKALGTGWSGGVGWHQVEILRTEGRSPRVRLSGRAADRARDLGAGRWHVSLTHQPGAAAAVAILESGAVRSDP